jgi:protein-disulfide isomerase
MRTWTFFALLLGGVMACGNQRSEARTNGTGTGAAGAAVATAAAGKAEDEQPPPGVDLSKLDEGERKIFFRVANKVGSACGRPHSLLHSAHHDPSCKRSILALRLAAKLADDGYLESEVVEAVEKRYIQKPQQIDVAEAPVKGDPKAAVSIVEFADFQCPHCRILQPVLERLLEEYKGQVRVYFKNFPLHIHGHENAEAAAQAAMAAQKQGKFWALTAKIWKNQDALSPPDLERYAQEVGLDVKKWKDDLNSAPIKDRVAKDRDDGDRLKISGTPAVYINGREIREPDYDRLKAAVDEELEASK